MVYRDKIYINLIIPEHEVRKEGLKQEFVESIRQEGLKKPLVVQEAKQKNKYYLVEGYRRYYALLQIGCDIVECEIHTETSKTDRLIKQLHRDIHLKRKTGYELERMIRLLISEGLDEKEIALATHVSVNTLRKHMRSFGVNEELKKEAEKNCAGKDGLTRLYFFKVIKDNLRSNLLDRYINRKLYAYVVDAIEKLTKVTRFEKLPEHLQDNCIKVAEDKAKFRPQDAKEIVHIECSKVTELYDDVVHETLFNKFKQDFIYLKEICSNDFVNKIYKTEKGKELFKLYNDLGLRLGFREEKKIIRIKPTNPKTNIKYE